MMNTRTPIIFVLLVVLLGSCSKSVNIEKHSEQLPDIFPDYVGVTIPPNIAPLNFYIKAEVEDAQATFSSGREKLTVDADKDAFKIPQGKWKKLIESAAGKSIKVEVAAKLKGVWTGFAPFEIHVAKEPVDPYLAYRLIEPGYELWNEMGIYQRHLESFDQSAIMENKMTEKNCMNCHSFCQQDPQKMLFHMRGGFAGTYIIDGDKIEKLNTKTEQTMSALVYPSWHSSGKYVAFTVNDTKQGFHTMNANRVEVYDNASDVVVYDVAKHEIVTCPQLFSKKYFETFPTFSPDGKMLYFCVSDSCDMPKEFEKIRYSICAIGFDPDTRTFGSKVDTLYNARTEGKSASFPRISPDGRFLLHTRGDYGGFFVWHKEADLYITDLKTNESFPLTAANSPDAESYHSWSSNSKWIVFSSRRTDGLYTQPFIAYIDAEGKAGKAFLLPQKDPHFYEGMMKSFNVPEFIKGKVDVSQYSISQHAKNDKGVNVQFHP